MSIVVVKCFVYIWLKKFSLSSLLKECKKIGAFHLWSWKNLRFLFRCNNAKCSVFASSTTELHSAFGYRVGNAQKLRKLSAGSRLRLNLCLHLHSSTETKSWLVFSLNQIGANVFAQSLKVSLCLLSFTYWAWELLSPPNEEWTIQLVLKA